MRSGSRRRPRADPEWQTPQAKTSTTTPPGSAVGVGTSWMASGAPGAVKMTARIVSLFVKYDGKMLEWPLPTKWNTTFILFAMINQVHLAPGMEV